MPDQRRQVFGSRLLTGQGAMFLPFQRRCELVGAERPVRVD
jgi:hypothetical protein